MLSADESYKVFEKSIHDYHRKDDVNAPIQNPFPPGSFESLLYLKNWIDTVQWHLEDLIRNPDIDPAEGLQLKRRIDKSLLLPQRSDACGQPSGSPELKGPHRPLRKSAALGSW